MYKEPSFTNYYYTCQHKTDGQYPPVLYLMAVAYQNICAARNVRVMRFCVLARLLLRGLRSLGCRPSPWPRFRGFVGSAGPHKGMAEGIVLGGCADAPYCGAGGGGGGDGVRAVGGGGAIPVGRGRSRRSGGGRASFARRALSQHYVRTTDARARPASEMAQLITVRLNKSDQQPLGFRLQGGKDFGTPLVVQKVNGGSAAERAGLQAGDALIRVNSTDVYNLRHQEAQDAIRAAGVALELTVQRGGGTWRPTVTPTGSLPRPGTRPLGAAPAPVTTTSLKATPQPSRNFGSGHNSVAKPFGYMNGNGIGNKQYNSPVSMYSDKTIAETLSAQTEVLAGGVLGVNFKKNEKTYDAEKSAVFKVLQEEQNDPEPVEASGAPVSPAPAPAPVTGLRHVTAPVTKPDAPLNTGGLPPGQNICEECERLITGVFVRIKDKNLHVECFKCSTCGSSLKNQGYYNINGKLYCDIHAKLVARQNPPAPNLEPVTVPPGGRIPTNSYSTPLPPLATNNYTNGSSSMFSPSSNLSSSGPKPFGSSLGSAYSPSLSPRSAPMSPARPVAAPAPASAPAPAAPVTPAPAPFAPKGPVSIFKGSSVGGAARGKAFGVSSAPKRGRGVLNKAVMPGSRVPLCASCNGNIRGPFITALGRIWCPEHFICVNATCRRQLQDIGFVEENGQLYCEFCFEQYIAPACDKCHAKIKGDCLNAIGKHFHPECFNCVYCGKLFGNNPFFLEDGLPYCEAGNSPFVSPVLSYFYMTGMSCSQQNVSLADSPWRRATGGSRRSTITTTVSASTARYARRISKGRASSPEEADHIAGYTPVNNPGRIIYNSDTVYSTTVFRPVSLSPPTQHEADSLPPQRTRKLETPLHFEGGLFSDIRSSDGKLLSKVTVDRVHSSTRRDVIDSPSTSESIGLHVQEESESFKLNEEREANLTFEDTKMNKIDEETEIQFSEKNLDNVTNSHSDDENKNSLAKESIAISTHIDEYSKSYKTKLNSVKIVLIYAKTARDDVICHF
ncbi:unnamed protein product, partial [Iphiclides podalirius]